MSDRLETPPTWLSTLLQRFDRVEAQLEALRQQTQVKDWYTTAELAPLLGKAEFTIREWCRLGRIHAEKRHSGRGAHPAWVVSHEEVGRYQREGLLPLRIVSPSCPDR